MVAGGADFAHAVVRRAGQRRREHLRAPDRRRTASCDHRLGGGPGHGGPPRHRAARPRRLRAGLAGPLPRRRTPLERLAALRGRLAPRCPAGTRQRAAGSRRARRALAGPGRRCSSRSAPWRSPAGSSGRSATSGARRGGASGRSAPWPHLPWSGPGSSPRSCGPFAPGARSGRGSDETWVTLALDALGPPLAGQGGRTGRRSGARCGRGARTGRNRPAGRDGSPWSHW